MFIFNLFDKPHLFFFPFQTNWAGIDVGMTMLTFSCPSEPKYIDGYVSCDLNLEINEG